MSRKIQILPGLRKQHSLLRETQFLTEKRPCRRMSVSERSRSQTMMERISQNIAQRGNNMIQAINYCNERELFTQPPLPGVLLIEIPRICISLNMEQVLRTCTADAFMEMRGHDRLCHKVRSGCGNSQSQTIEAIRIVFLTTAVRLLPCRETNMISLLFHDHKVSKRYPLNENFNG